MGPLPELTAVTAQTVALLGGILGLRPDDERIVDAFKIAADRGLNYQFKISYDEVDHPNTVNIHLETAAGYLLGYSRHLHRRRQNGDQSTKRHSNRIHWRL